MIRIREGNIVRTTESSLIKQVKDAFFTVNSLSIKLNIIFFFIVAYLLHKYEYVQQKDTNRVISFIDSINKANIIYFEKIDSLERIKHEEYFRYEKITLKYDTIQIAIDTMPDVAGTKYLLTVSRQLTAKGIE